MLTSYSEYQFEKMLAEMVPGVGTVDASNNSVPMMPPAPTAPTTAPASQGMAPGKPGTNPQQLQQIKASLTQAWQLISKTPAAKDVMPLFAQILNKVGFKVTGQGAQMAGQQPGQQPAQGAATQVTVGGLTPETKTALMQFPKLSAILQQLAGYAARKGDVGQALAELINGNSQRFPVWEQQAASGQLNAQTLLSKVQAHYNAKKLGQ